MSESTKEAAIDKLRDLLRTQGQPGNWNFDSYMHGMYNGMEFALSVLEEREPIYRDAPKEWMSDRMNKAPKKNTIGFGT